MVTHLGEYPAFACMQGRGAGAGSSTLPVTLKREEAVKRKSIFILHRVWVGVVINETLQLIGCVEAGASHL